ncbi:MAG: ribonuclease HII, partial [Heyndrickxia sp.]
IIAKITRDRMMTEYSNHYPHYYFEKNMGYGTKEHLLALNTYGPCVIHRKSFAPIKDMI